MHIILKGKNVEVTPSMAELAYSKLAKLERYLPEIDLVEVEFSVERTKSVVDREIVEALLDVGGDLFRAVERAGEMRVALDGVVDQLQNQIKDYRSRERARTRGRTPSERFIIADEGPTGGDYGVVLPLPSAEAEEVARVERHLGSS